MSRDKKFSGEYGGKVLCTRCNATTDVSERSEKVHEYFTVGCSYCQWLDISDLRDQLEKVTTQRDALAAAIDVKRTLVAVALPKGPTP